jgi:hypothetical protein
MAAANVQVEANTTPATDAINDLFAYLPDDTRFYKVCTQRFDPITEIINSESPTSEVKFVLPKLYYPQCYLLNQCLIYITSVIQKSDGTALPTTSKIFPINNALHSVIRTCKLELNDTPLTLGSDDCYYLRAYLENLFSHAKSQSNHLVSVQGWCYDYGPNFCEYSNPSQPNEPGVNNQPLKFRQSFYRQGLDENAAFSTEGATFCGPLFHELLHSQKLLPPLTKVTITLSRTSSDFFLCSGDPTDKSKYKIVLKEIYLLVPVAELSDIYTNQLRTHIEKKPIHYKYKTFRITRYPIEKALNYITPSLFDTLRNPIRVYIAIADSKALAGCLDKSPYEFKSKWTYEVNKTTTFAQVLEDFREKARRESEKRLSLQMREMQMLKESLGLLIQAMGGNAPAVVPAAMPISSQSFGGADDDGGGKDGGGSDPKPITPIVKEKKTIYLKKMQLLLYGDLPNAGPSALGS